MMTKLTALMRGIVTMIAVLAAATAFGLTAEPASAWGRFSDNSEAYVYLNCQPHFGRMQGYSWARYDFGQPSYVKLSVWDQRGWVYLGNWEQVGSPYGISIYLGAQGIQRWVYVDYGRYINSRWEQYGEWLILANGAQSCYL